MATRKFGRLDGYSTEDRFARPEAGWAKQALLRRSRLLAPRDRLLLELSLAGFPVRQIAQGAGMHPGTVSRRVGMLKRLLGSEVAAALADFAEELPDTHRRLGVEHFIGRIGVRKLARRHGMPPGEVMQALGYLRAWAMLRRADLTRAR